VENFEGVRLLGLFERKRKCVSRFLFLGSRGHYGGASGILAEEQGFPELISDYGTQTARL
jgi:hypothetical protein